MKIPQHPRVCGRAVKSGDSEPTDSSPFSIPHSFPHASRGFTIIELLVTATIYTIISTVVLANYRDYNNNALSLNAPEDIVLSLRQAQVYGAGGKGCVPSTFDCRYGVVFTAESGSENGLTIFTDLNDNKMYDVLDTEIETITWKDASVISKVECLRYSGPDTTCSNGMLNITFKRPSPDALINDTADMSGLTSGGYELGRIVVWNGVAGSGSKYSITTISQTGQISIQ